MTEDALDGDALTTFCHAESAMTHEIMDHRVKVDPVTIERLYAPDARKPWTEPTVTECATRDRRPATLTIAGVDLPNPGARLDADQLIGELEHKAKYIGEASQWGGIDWKCGKHGGEVGKSYASHIRAAIAELQRQAAEIAELRGRPTDQHWDTMANAAEAHADNADRVGMHEFAKFLRELSKSAISIVRERAELQGMLEEAIGPVHFVSQLANMTATECESDLLLYSIRYRARQQLKDDYALPRLYSEEDRKRAIRGIEETCAMSHVLAGEIVEIVAAALGLGRAS